MRCSCINCGVYMIQSESSNFGCVCPECGTRCIVCLGTDSIINKDEIKLIKNDPVLAEMFLKRLMHKEDFENESDFIEV